MPANSGGRIGVFKRIEQVAKTEKIFLFYPYDNKEELKFVSELKKYCEEVYVYNRKSNIIKTFSKLFKYPFTVASRQIAQMQIDIQRCIEENKIDLINVDFPHMCVNLLSISTNIPIILNEHNIEWKVYNMISKSHNNILKKIVYGIDSYRLKTYEEKMIHDLNISLYTFVSDKDKEYFITNKNIPEQKCCLIPVGADSHVIRKNKNVQKGIINIVFVGKMSYAPNIEAVKWFVQKIYQQIKDVIKDCKLYIVGKEPTQEVINLHSDDIIVTGCVESVESYYNMADIVVLPLLSGGGVKVKLLEAISYKKNIISTSIGVEGTIYADGKTIPICDDPTSFAQECIKCILNKEEYTNRLEQAFLIYKQNYTWKSVGKKYIECMRVLANNEK